MSKSRQNPHPHYVYFIQCLADIEPIKIGVSRNPSHRIHCLQTANPFKIMTVKKVKFRNEQQAYAIESKLHEIFKKHRIRREWFEKECLQDAIRLCEKYANKNIRYEIEIVPRDLDDQHLLENEHLIEWPKNNDNTKTS